MLPVIRHVLFDLDGTLTDSAEGITRCIEHAVVRSGGVASDRLALRRFIGSPLSEIFQTLLETDHPEHIRRAISHYTERFDRVGYRENRLYDQVEELLGELADRGFSLYVATAKRQADATRVIEHFGLEPRFDGVFGVVEDAERRDKSVLVRRILETHAVEPETAVMIGDRSHDVLGALRAGVRALGAAWGYGSIEELRDAGASRIAQSPRDVLECIAG